MPKKGYKMTEAHKNKIKSGVSGYHSCASKACSKANRAKTNAIHEKTKVKKKPKDDMLETIKILKSMKFPKDDKIKVIKTVKVSKPKSKPKPKEKKKKSVRFSDKNEVKTYNLTKEEREGKRDRDKSKVGPCPKIKNINEGSFPCKKKMTTFTNLSEFNKYVDLRRSRIMAVDNQNIEDFDLQELREFVKENKLFTGYSTMKKAELVKRILGRK